MNKKQLENHLRTDFQKKVPVHFNNFQIKFSLSWNELMEKIIKYALEPGYEEWNMFYISCTGRTYTAMGDYEDRHMRKGFKGWFLEFTSGMIGEPPGILSLERIEEYVAKERNGMYLSWDVKTGKLSENEIFINDEQVNNNPQSNPREVTDEEWIALLGYIPA